MLSNASDDIDVSRLVHMQGSRFLIEHVFREARSELAMANYQVRRQDAWYRHMALVMIVMLFMTGERLFHWSKKPLCYRRPIW